MAKEKRGGEGKGSEHISKQDVQLGDITTAATSTMGPRDYSEGWPSNEGALHNKNFGGKNREK